MPKQQVTALFFLVIQPQSQGVKFHVFGFSWSEFSVYKVRKIDHKIGLTLRNGKKITLKSRQWLTLSKGGGGGDGEHGPRGLKPDK